MNKVIHSSYIIIWLREREFQKQLGNRFYQESSKSKTKEKYINHNKSTETTERENNILLPPEELPSKAHSVGRCYRDPRISQLLTLSLTASFEQL